MNGHRFSELNLKSMTLTCLIATFTVKVGSNNKKGDTIQLQYLEIQDNFDEIPHSHDKIPTTVYSHL